MTTMTTPEPIWKQRFRAPIVSFVGLAQNNSTRGLVASNLSGVVQLHGWDTVNGSLRQATFASTGKQFGAISPDGQYIYYLQDEKGNELGHMVRVPFAGGEPEDITPDLPPYTAFEIAFSRNGHKGVFVKALVGGFEVCLISLDENQNIINVRTIYHSNKLLSTPVISSDGRFVAFQSTERSGKLHFNLIVMNTETNQIVHDLWDSDGGSLHGCEFSPNDHGLQLLGSTNVSGQVRPLLLDVDSGHRTDFEFTNIDGDVEPISWSPNGQRLLLCQIHNAEQRIYTYHLENQTLIKLRHPSGSFSPYMSGPTFVNEDEIYCGWEDSAHPPHVVVLDGWTGEFIRIALRVGEALPSMPWQSVSFPSSDQMPVQAWLATPEGNGPFPVVIDIHGGPSAVTLDHFNPSSQAWLDHGLAFISINYHGSTTFGKAFQDKIIGNLGYWEVEDIEATYHWLVTQGIADPEKVFISGWSYGGYLTLLSLGRLPDYWAGGMAGIAIADWRLMYEDQSEILRGYQVALFGGTPEEKPEEHQVSSPITYVENIRAPLLIIQGANDTRCPVRQMEAYLELLQQQGKVFSISWFEAGHGANAVELQIEHQEKMLQFVSDILGEVES